MGLEHVERFVHDMRDSFQWESAEISKIIGGYVAGYVDYSPKRGDVFVQVFVDPRKRTDQRYTFSIKDISAPVMRLDWSIETDKFYDEPGYNARWVLQEMESRIASDLDFYQKNGYDPQYT